MGAGMAYLGGQFGQTLGVDKWFSGILSPLLRETLISTTTNTIIGGLIGGGLAVLDDDPNTNFWSGAWDGVKMGAVTGAISGVGNAVQYSLDNKVNMLTGKPTGQNNAYYHDYQYDDRVRMRATQDPRSHNFPYSYDDAILSTTPTITSSGYKMYQIEGTMNGMRGYYEIGVTQDGIINHRFFRPTK
ncbi:hypothetical protein FACS18947_1130 [Bacteroidia bacterium]|nr:hypothetical protein FACS18947_1130 [Bacteroidia bacterium]